jgi:hypothetical protein
MLTRYGLKVVDVASEKWVEIQFVNTDEVNNKMTTMLIPRKSSTTFVLL